MVSNCQYFKYWSGVFKNYLSSKSNGSHVKVFSHRSELMRYSTAIPKCCIDVFEIFTDLLIFNRSRNSQQVLKTIPVIPNITSDDKADQLIQMLDKALKKNSVVVVENELKRNIHNGNWSSAVTIMRFCIDRQVHVNSSKMKYYAQAYSDRGFVEGMNVLLQWYCCIDPQEYAHAGELMHYLAKCYWVIGNIKKCVSILRDCIRKYPSSNNTTKLILKGIISETISSRSEAELRIIVDFVKQLTREIQDYYSISVLWNYLFLSDWFTDQNLAIALVDEFEELKLCINLMSSSLTVYLIRSGKVPDLYRFLQILLRYEMKGSYGKVSQIMFDHFCKQGDIRRCSEIVKSSIRLTIPLRDEQYNQFISWSITGDRFKFISKAEIEKIYSRF